MVISINQLKNVLYKKQINERKNIKDHDRFYVTFFLRKVALYIIWFLLHFKNITPTDINLLGIFIGLICTIFFATGQYVFCGAGAILLILWYVLDQVDGGLARYKGICSIEGHNLDATNGHMIELFVFVGIVFGVFVKTNNLLFLGLGMLMIASFAMYSILINLRYSTYIFFKYHYKNATKKTNYQKNQEQVYKETKNISLIFKLINVFSRLMFLFQLPAKVNLVLIFSLLGRLEYVVIFYALTHPFFLMANIYFQYNGGLIDFFKRVDIYLETGQGC